MEQHALKQKKHFLLSSYIYFVCDTLTLALTLKDESICTSLLYI